MSMTSVFRRVNNNNQRQENLGDKMTTTRNIGVSSPNIDNEEEILSVAPISPDHAVKVTGKDFKNSANELTSYINQQLEIRFADPEPRRKDQDGDPESAGGKRYATVVLSMKDENIAKHTMKVRRYVIERYKQTTPAWYVELDFINEIITFKRKMDNYTPHNSR
jgi:hypothetical protein